MLTTANTPNSSDSFLTNLIGIKAGNSSNKKEIGLSLVIRKILEIDDNNSRFRINLMLGLEWTDARLQFLNLKGTVERIDNGFLKPFISMSAVLFILQKFISNGFAKLLLMGQPYKFYGESFLLCQRTAVFIKFLVAPLFESSYGFTISCHKGTVL
jgi:hypothetical protein